MIYKIYISRACIRNLNLRVQSVLCQQQYLEPQNLRVQKVMSQRSTSLCTHCNCANAFPDKNFYYSFFPFDSYSFYLIDFPIQGYGIAMAHGTPYKPLIDSAILHLQEGGVLHKLRVKWWKQKRGLSIYLFVCPHGQGAFTNYVCIQGWLGGQKNAKFTT